MTTRNEFANLCGFHSFISSVEPLKVYEALEDVDWIEAIPLAFLYMFRHELVDIVSSLANILFNLGYLLMRKEATTYKGFVRVELQRRHPWLLDLRHGSSSIFFEVC